MSLTLLFVGSSGTGGGPIPNWPCVTSFEDSFGGDAGPLDAHWTHVYQNSGSGTWQRDGSGNAEIAADTVVNAEGQMNDREMCSTEHAILAERYDTGLTLAEATWLGGWVGSSSPTSKDDCYLGMAGYVAGSGNGRFYIESNVGGSATTLLYTSYTINGLWQVRVTTTYDAGLERNIVQVRDGYPSGTSSATTYDGAMIDGNYVGLYGALYANANAALSISSFSAGDL